MTRKELAMQNFKKGYNCAQAVLLAFADLIDIDKDTLAKIASPFGGGMGRMREVCGSVSGMLLANGYLNGYSSPQAKEEKMELYANVQELAGKFKEQNGSIICRELLNGVAPTNPVPEERTAEYYKKRPCVELVGMAAEILDNYLQSK